MSEGERLESETSKPAAPQTPAPTPSPGAWRIGRVMLAPLLAITAVGVHFVVNVPSERTIAENKRQAQGERDKQAAERRGTKKSPPPVSNEPWTPRSSAQLTAVEQHFRGTPFDDEPVIAEWSRQAQYFINRAISVARKNAFSARPERPQVSIRELKCRSVRCRFVVKAESPADADALIEAFRAVRVGGKAIWRAFETKNVGGSGGSQVRVTVTMREDKPDPKALVEPTGAPGAPPAPGVPPSGVAPGAPGKSPAAANAKKADAKAPSEAAPAKKPSAAPPRAATPAKAEGKGSPTAPTSP